MLPFSESRETKSTHAKIFCMCRRRDANSKMSMYDIVGFGAILTEPMGVKGIS